MTRTSLTDFTKEELQAALNLHVQAMADSQHYIDMYEELQFEQAPPHHKMHFEMHQLWASQILNAMHAVNRSETIKSN